MELAGSFRDMGPHTKGFCRISIPHSPANRTSTTHIGYIDLITPNIPEYQQLFGAQEAQQVVAEYHCALLLKGGHSTTEQVTDLLYQPEETTIEITSQKVEGDWQKHGTGCVLSAAIAAQIATERSLPEACKNAHFYVKQFIASDEGLLGFHPNPEAL